MWRRSFHSFLPILKRLDPLNPKFVEKCPLPVYDTGCTHCQPVFPPDKQIDYTKPLRSSKASVWKHLLIIDETDPRDWNSKIERDVKTFALQIAKYKWGIISPNHPVLVNNVHFNGFRQDSDTLRTILYPDNVIIDIPRDFVNNGEYVEDFIKKFLTPSQEDWVPVNKIDASPHNKRLVLVCGHLQRDLRCGILAPLLINEFSQVLSDKNLSDVEVGTISHVGGHLFAGNVLFFNERGESIWYGRVHPENVQGIIEETVVKGNVIEELFRG